jgi:hypothetical protein
MQFDPRSPEFRANPYPTYELLRVHAPIFYWEAWGLWFLSRHEDCHALLRDNRLGRGRGGSAATAPPQQRPLFEMMDRWMLPLTRRIIRAAIAGPGIYAMVAQPRRDQRLTDDRSTVQTTADLITTITHCPSR